MSSKYEFRYNSKGGAMSEAAGPHCSLEDSQIQEGGEIWKLTCTRRVFLRFFLQNLITKKFQLTTVRLKRAFKVSLSLQ